MNSTCDSESSSASDVKAQAHVEQFQVNAYPRVSETISPTYSKTEVLSQQTIEKAREKLLEGCSVVMCENVSLSEAKEFLDQNESRGVRCTFVPHDSIIKECDNQIHGKLIALELPTHAHQSVTACLTWEVFNGLFPFSGTTASVELKSSPTFQIGKILKEPDLTISPIDGRGRRTARLPTVVFETAYRNESMQQLKDSLGQWTATVPMAVGIKICDEKNDAIPMHILVYKNDAIQNPVKTISFGTDVQVQGQFLEIPFADIYHGTEESQNEKIKSAIERQDCIKINLSVLQERILEVMFQLKNIFSLPDAALMLVVCRTWRSTRTSKLRSWPPIQCQPVFQAQSSRAPIQK